MYKAHEVCVGRGKWNEVRERERACTSPPPLPCSFFSFRRRPSCLFDQEEG